MEITSDRTWIAGMVIAAGIEGGRVKTCRPVGCLLSDAEVGGVELLGELLGDGAAGSPAESTPVTGRTFTLPCAEGGGCGADRCAEMASARTTTPPTAATRASR